MNRSTHSLCLVPLLNHLYIDVAISPFSQGDTDTLAMNMPLNLGTDIVTAMSLMAAT